MGGKPDETASEDITVSTLKEAANFQRTENTSEYGKFRVERVKLLQSDVNTGIEELNGAETVNADATEAYYTLSGIRLSKAPQSGLYIVRKGAASRVVVR